MKMKFGRLPSRTFFFGINICFKVNGMLRLRLNQYVYLMSYSFPVYSQWHTSSHGPKTHLIGKKFL